MLCAGGNDKRFTFLDEAFFAFHDCAHGPFDDVRYLIARMNLFRSAIFPGLQFHRHNLRFLGCAEDRKELPFPFVWF